ncbi:MAG TPA: uracil-DNA glycosylase family protein, partial [Bacteroidia bacterium]|nr:uracil-DNA glycosylase family protein [Bacteroidia bacterium]
NERVFILGINPGRFGGGVTGIPFTDPIRLEKECGITNPFAKKPEVSSEFIYTMINAYGGPEKFYGKYFINSLFPLALTHKGKNINYYDTKELLEITRQPIIENIRTQIAFGLRTDKAICLGEGKNYQYLVKLNTEYKFFGEIHPLPHPRFIMQYKRKFLKEYIGRYLETFKKVEFTV